MKPTLPKGTRDFLPLDIRKRDYIFNIIKNQFHLFGFDSIETPAMESLETLSGNYGDEGDRLLFKVLNNGDFLKDVPEEILGSKNSNKAITHLSKRGLRYDLTVPFARFIVMNRQHIKFPFKRSAIQPVWRADRPQRGRYQEFYQCDADVAGSSSLFYESELIRLYDEVFDQLSLPVTIRWNNRKILYGIAESAGLKDHFNLITIIIDKLDKIGNDGVVKELESQAFDSKDVSKLMEMISTTTLPELKAKMQSEQGHLGISEMERVLSFLDSNGLKNELSSTTLLKLRPISLAVPGMNCHNPIAPAGEIAFGFNEDSMTEIILSSTGRLYLLSAWSKKGKYMVALPNKCSDVVR